MKEIIIAVAVLSAVSLASAQRELVAGSQVQSTTAVPAAEAQPAPFAATRAAEVNEETSGGQSRFNLRFGAKGVFAGLLWSQPDNVPAYAAVDYWGKNQFYIGGGAGIFVELNALRFLAFEINFLYEANSLTFHQTYTINGVSIEYDYNTKFGQVRLPLLIKGVLPLGESAELSLGLGPEFVVGTSAKVAIDRKTDLGPAANQVADAYLAGYHAKKAGGTFFDLDLGVNIKVWKLMIPIDIRAGFNLSQPAEYSKRVDLVSLAGPATVKAIESMNFAALIGVGYVLPL